MSRWPDPADVAVDRARAVCYSYRQALLEVDPARCATLDRVARELGEHWVAPSETAPQIGDRISTERAAEMLGLTTSTIRGWVSKPAIPISRGADGLLDVAELLEYRASQRRRRGRR